MSVYEKGLNHLKSLIGQPVGNYQCYAVAAVYSGIMKGPDLGAGTSYNQLEIIGDIYSASEIGNAYPWSKYGWEVIQNPEYDQLAIGDILCYERNVALSDTFTTHEYYGHCAVIYGLENGMIQAYEQKGELGEIVQFYDREFLGSDSIASIVKPPDFSGTPTDFIHGQAPMDA
ncbi:CHAP domain-containing protein [Enterococcus pseudoavium]|uniref:CHAP domain-containing protein n=1 Tax=Enterococcus pseudoavium TaxID=44007 RepID=A0AAE4I180_9ENTE|nr:CHAP domain-containing protein [Enterococcus pseudoavium]MDT2737695.1 CHAP domain-containing protein [Enterococcus pseudoavium]